MPPRPSVSRRAVPSFRVFDRRSRRSVLRLAAMGLVALVLLAACTPGERGLKPLPTPPAEVSTTVTLPAGRPSLELAPGQSVVVDIANVDDTRGVTWSVSTDPPSSGVSVSPSSSTTPLGPGGVDSITITADPSAAPGTFVIEVAGDEDALPSGDASSAFLEVHVTSPAATPADGAIDLEIGTSRLRLGDNTVAEVFLQNADTASSAWTATQSDASRIRIEGSVAGVRSGTVAAGETDRARLYAIRSTTESTPQSYAGAVVVDTPAGVRPIDTSYEVTATSDTDACGGPLLTSPARTRASASLASSPTGSDVLVTSGDAALAPTSDVVPGQLVVGWHTSELATASRRDLAAGVGSTLVRGGRGERVSLLRIPATSDPRAVAARVARDPRVAFAEPNVLLRTQGVPDDAYIGDQWTLCLFGAPAAWDVETGASSVVVAIIDEGIDDDHPDLVARLVPGLDLCPETSPTGCAETEAAFTYDTDPFSTADHGTHVAGIAAATGDNGTGVAGVAYGGARILPIKVFGDDGQFATSYGVSLAIRWAAGLPVAGLPGNPNPAQVINLSLGGCDTGATVGCGRIEAMEFAAEDAVAAGAVVVAAAGNVPGDLTFRGITYPANAPAIIAVGSINSNRQRSSFSRFDVTGGPTVEVMAPGGRLVGGSALVLSTAFDDAYAEMAGTSMASPYVAGIAALLKSAEPTLTPAQIRQRLSTSAWSDPGWDEAEYGAGLICADAALGLGTTCGE